MIRNLLYTEILQKTIASEVLQEVRDLNPFVKPAISALLAALLAVHIMNRFTVKGMKRNVWKTIHNCDIF